MKELLLLSGLGIAVLVLEIIKQRKLILPLIVLGLLANIGLCIHDYSREEYVYGMLFFDQTEHLFTILISAVGIAWFLMARNYLDKVSHISDYSSLILFSMVGSVILVSYINMTMLFLGIEILSIPVYVMAGSDKRNIASNEASFKYFLMGAFASSFLLLGIAFLYGATGSFNITAIPKILAMSRGVGFELVLLGILLILFALSFKVAAVPFHFWSPDVYVGSPTPVTAYMATIVKISALIAFFRLFWDAFFILFPVYGVYILLIALLTIVTGNILAVSQSNVKRMLAFSGIGHAGFVLLGMAIQKINIIQSEVQYAEQSIIYYIVAYAFTGIAAFWVVNIVTANGNEEVNAFNGLVKRNPVLAGTLTLALLSMAGIPPVSGFFAKYFILFNAIRGGNIWAAVIAILASLVGVYYYFRLIIAIFFRTSENNDKIRVDWITTISLLILCLLILGLGLYPDFIFSIVK